MKKFLVGLMTALFCLCLAACAPANLEKADEKMTDAGYKVVVTEDGDAVDFLYGEEAVGTIVATKSSGSLTTGFDVESMTAILFEDASAAKEYAEKINGDEENVKQDGKWVYFGSEAAIEDFTK